VAGDVVSWLQVMEDKNVRAAHLEGAGGARIDGQDRYPLSAHACHIQHPGKLSAGLYNKHFTLRSKLVCTVLRTPDSCCSTVGSIVHLFGRIV
jgi:hypothetical protein